MNFIRIVIARSLHEEGGVCIRNGEHVFVFGGNKIPVEGINTGICITDVTRSVCADGCELVRAFGFGNGKISAFRRRESCGSMEIPVLCCDAVIFFTRSESVCVDIHTVNNFTAYQRLNHTAGGINNFCFGSGRDDDVDVGRLKARNVQRVGKCSCDVFFCIHGIFNRNIYSGAFADAFENNLALRIIAVHENSVIGKNGEG